MKIFSLIVSIILFYISFNSHAQILHAESFSVILDTSKMIKGSIVPDFKFQNQKEDLIEFENISDVTFRRHNNALSIANKIELSKYGDEVLMSGGYLYIEYRKIFDIKLTVEPFSQFQWSEARGLGFKYAGGLYARYRHIQTEKVGLFAGIGPFYEYERWNYEGVQDHLILENSEDIIQKNFKLGSYISFKWLSDYNLTFDFSAYHQSRFDQIFSSPRLASSSSITYNFTEHLGLILIYQNIYDFSPVVPIEKLFNRVLCTVDVSF